MPFFDIISRRLSTFYKGSMLILVGLFFGKLIAMTNNVILARCLHAHDYGIILLGLSLFELANVPSGSGIPSLLPKFVAELRSKGMPRRINDIFLITIGSCMGLSALIGLAAFILSGSISEGVFRIPELGSVLRVLVFATPFTVGSAIIIAVFRGFEKVTPRVVLQDLLTPFLKVLLFAALFFAGLRLQAASWAFLLANLVIFSTLLLLLRKTFAMSLRVVSYDRDTTMNLIRLAWPMSLQSLLIIVYSQIDRICLGYFMGPRDVGIYGAAYSITSMLIIIPMAFTYLALPRFSHLLSEGNMPAFKAVFGQISHTTYIISLPVCIAVVLFARNLLMVLYGKEYAGGEIVLWILTAGIFSNCIIGPAADSLVAFGKTRAPLYAAAAGCIANLVLNIILIPVFKMEGAAVATCISMYLSKALLGFQNYRHLGVFPLDLRYLLWLTVSLCSAVPVMYLSRIVMASHYFFQALLLGSAYVLVNFAVFYALRRQAGTWSEAR